MFEAGVGVAAVGCTGAGVAAAVADVPAPPLPPPEQACSASHGASSQTGNGIRVRTDYVLAAFTFSTRVSLCASRYFVALTARIIVTSQDLGKAALRLAG